MLEGFWMEVFNVRRRMTARNQFLQMGSPLPVAQLLSMCPSAVTLSTVLSIFKLPLEYIIITFIPIHL